MSLICDITNNTGAKPSSVCRSREVPTNTCTFQNDGFHFWDFNVVQILQNEQL